jgi:hypothetical protein
MNSLVGSFDKLVYIALGCLAISALGILGCYLTVVVSKLAGWNAASVLSKTSQWSVRLAWIGAALFVISLIVFLIVGIGHDLIYGYPLG